MKLRQWKHIYTSALKSSTVDLLILGLRLELEMCFTLDVRGARGCLSYNLWYVGSTHDGKKRNTHIQAHSHMWTDTHTHTFPTEPWLSLLDYPVPVGSALLLGTRGLVLCGWLASVLRVLGAQVTGLSCCCCHWPQPSELLSHSDPGQRTVCCFIRSLHHL